MRSEELAKMEGSPPGGTRRARRKTGSKKKRFETVPLGAVYACCNIFKSLSLAYITLVSANDASAWMIHELGYVITGGT
jgi:hypothetical protein